MKRFALPALFATLLFAAPEVYGEAPLPGPQVQGPEWVVRRAELSLQKEKIFAAKRELAKALLAINQAEITLLNEQLRNMRNSQKFHSNKDEIERAKFDNQRDDLKENSNHIDALESRAEAMQETADSLRQTWSQNIDSKRSELEENKKNLERQLVEALSIQLDTVDKLNGLFFADSKDQGDFQALQAKQTETQEKISSLKRQLIETNGMRADTFFAASSSELLANIKQLTEKRDELATEDRDLEKKVEANLGRKQLVAESDEDADSDVKPEKIFLEQKENSIELGRLRNRQAANQLNQEIIDKELSQLLSVGQAKAEQAESELRAKRRVFSMERQWLDSEKKLSQSYLEVLDKEKPLLKTSEPEMKTWQQHAQDANAKSKALAVQEQKLTASEKESNTAFQLLEKLIADFSDQRQDIEREAATEGRIKLTQARAITRSLTRNQKEIVKAYDQTQTLAAKRDALNSRAAELQTAQGQLDQNKSDLGKKQKDLAQERLGYQTQGIAPNATAKERKKLKRELSSLDREEKRLTKTEEKIDDRQFEVNKKKDKYARDDANLTQATTDNIHNIALLRSEQETLTSVLAYLGPKELEIPLAEKKTRRHHHVKKIGKAAHRLGHTRAALNHRRDADS